MAFEVFIKRTPDGREVDFDHNFEREPVIQIARSLHNQFSQDSKYYALLANVEIPSKGKGNTRQIDAILLSEDGMAVIDFKSANAPFTPTLDDRPWIYSNGKPVKAGKNNNPYRQVEQQRFAVYRFLQRLPEFLDKNQLNKRFLQHAGRSLKGRKFNDKFFHFNILGRVVLTGERFELPYMKREHYQQWFDIIWHDQCADLAKMMSFNQSVKLHQTHIKPLIETMFGLSPWIELESLYQKPFGFLTGSTVPIPVPLLNSVVKLGRNSSIAVRISSGMKHVSREHAIIRQTPDGPMIRDADSRNGTWVNGNKLVDNEARLLKHNDMITLGRLRDGKPSEQSVQFRYVTQLDQLPHLNLPELEDTIGMTAINDVIADDQL